MYKVSFVDQFTNLYLWIGSDRVTMTIMLAEEVFAALAAPQRQEILRLVRDEPMSVGDIAEGCGASQQAVSHHLQVLKDAGLVQMQRVGRRHLYLVNPDGFESVSSFVADLWPNSLEKLQAVFESPKK